MTYKYAFSLTKYGCSTHALDGIWYAKVPFLTPLLPQSSQAEVLPYKNYILQQVFVTTTSMTPSVNGMEGHFDFCIHEYFIDPVQLQCSVRLKTMSPVLY